MFIIIYNVWAETWMYWVHTYKSRSETRCVYSAYSLDVWAALRFETELKLVAQLSFIVDEVDEIWTEFTTENDMVIDCLVDLGRESEYFIDQIAQLCDLISLSRAIVNR